MKRIVAMALLVGCSADPSPARDASTDAPPAPAVVRMDFATTQDFYATPFPSEHRRRAEGGFELSRYPNPRGVDFVRVLLDLAGRQTGFGTTSGVFFSLTAPIDPAGLPDVHASLRNDATAYVINVQRGSEAYLRRAPVTTFFEADGGPFGAPNLLSLLPVQGRPLAPNTLYAAVLTTALRGRDGTPLRAPDTLSRWLAGTPPTGLSTRAQMAYSTAFSALREAGVDARTIAGIAVFETGDPTAGMRRALRDALPTQVPTITRPFEAAEVFADYCVFQTTMQMPVYQRGEAPYLNTGGDWTTDATGALVLQRREEARLWVTLPRRAMPAEGFPTAVFIRTGGGGERPLVDRGVQAMTGGPPLEMGAGPAREFARAGFAGVEIDGPHGGLRNVTHGDEQFLMFNITNPFALRDNLRQSALEIALLAHALPSLRIAATSCPGLVLPTGTDARFDTTRLALMGHSTGSAIAPLTLAVEPMYRAAILSGAGGSWIENIVHKLRPIPTRPVAETIVRYNGIGRSMGEHDPVLTLLQWAGEEADTQVFARAIVRAPWEGPPRHVLMLQGIVDSYILPPIANTLSLGMGLDLAGTPLDRDPRLARFTPLGDLLDLGDGRTTALPVRANVTNATTAVVVQHPQDAAEDGHETVFQTDPPKYQYRCFLASFARGTPEVRAVPSGDLLTAPCE